MDLPKTKRPSSLHVVTVAATAIAKGQLLQQECRLFVS
jgi:hypothetical protein